MKPFRHLLEDIYGGYPYAHSPKRLPEHIRVDTLQGLIGHHLVRRSWKAPNPQDDIIPINDTFHMRFEPQEPDHPTKRLHHGTFTLHPNQEEHKHVALLSYEVNRTGVINTRDRNGKIKSYNAYVGYPKNKYFELSKSGTLDIPHDFIQHVANHLGGVVLSGMSQSPGGISWWERAIRHGENTGNPVRFIHRTARIIHKIGGSTYSDEGVISVGGPVTMANRHDAYELNPNRDSGPNPSTIPQSDRLNTLLGLFAQDKYHRPAST